MKTETQVFEEWMRVKKELSHSREGSCANYCTKSYLEALAFVLDDPKLTRQLKE